MGPRIANGQRAAPARTREEHIAVSRFPTLSRRDVARATLSVELTYSEIMEGRLRDPVYRERVSS
jgi:hypothetical protein